MSAAFDTVDHYIHGWKQVLDLWTVVYLGLDHNYLHGRRQSILFNIKSAASFSINYGIPQGSVLGPLMFVIYTADTESIATEHALSSHFHADDSQLQVYGRPQDVNIPSTKLISFIDDNDAWMASNQLKHNQDKTDIQWHPATRRLKSINPSIADLSRGCARQQLSMISGCC